MKKVVYPLIAALILCLVAIGMLMSARVGDRNEVARLEQEVAALVDERAVWDAQKAQVSKSLSGVRGVLVKTLVDLEDVSSSLGTAMDTIAEGPSSTTVTPEASPTTADASTEKPTDAAVETSASPTPAPTKAPAATKAPLATEASKESETPAPKTTEQAVATAPPAPETTK